MKNYARHLWLSLLLLVGVTAIAVPGLNGTNEGTVLEIGTVEQLKEFRDAVNSGTTYAGTTVKLTADLNLSGETNWTPIGNLVSYPGQSFAGIFDGNGYTISNLTVNDNTPKYAVAGLFGSVENGTIKNLTVKNVNITSTYYAGGIVAYTANAPTIENCHVIGGTINTTPEKLDDGKYDNGCKAGGIMGGYAPKGTTINNCTVEDVTITGYRDIGGIVGYSGGTITNNTVKNVTVTQDLTNAYEGTPNTIGDIIGRSSGATLSNNKVIKSIVKVTDNEGKEAEYGDMKDAFDAINADPKESYTITLLKDATYTDAEQYRHAALAEGNTVTKNVIIDGAGHTLTFVGGGVRGFYTESTAAEKVTFQNMTIADNTRYDSQNGNNAWEFAYLEMGEAKTCPLEFTNVKFADGISVDGTKTTFTDCEFIADGNAKRSTQTAENCIWISNGEVIVNNCTFTGYRAIKLHEAYGTEIGSVVIDGCTFKDLSVKPAVAIGDLNAATSVTITNNTIEGVQKGDQEMYLYESDTDLANFTNNLSGNTFNAKNEAELTVALNSGMFNKAVLQGDIALTENVTCGLNEGTFTLVQGEKTLTAGDHSIALNPGVTIVTDKQTDIFSSADANFKVVETAVEGGYTYTVVAKEYVAKIGEKQYYSLAEAFEAATDGQTITVLTDIDLPSTIVVGKQVTLDLAGKTISNTSDLWGGDNWSFFSVRANGNLTVTGNGKIDAKENDCYTFDVRNGGILTIKNGTFTGNISCVYLINEAGTGVSTCNIEGGRFSIKQLANNVQDDKYRYLLNCHDASYASNTAKFNVTGGSFVNFNPANNLAEGTETNFCAAGYEAVQDGNVWTVQKAAVAKIGETKYYSLADAFEAAQTGQTITVLTDIDLPSTIAVTKQVTLDLAGKTISNTSDLWAGGNWSFFSVQATGNLTVTGNGTIDAKENDCFTFDVRDGGILTIKDGTYTGNISSVYLINEAGTGVSTCNIEGGTFSIKQIDGTSGYNFLLNCLDASYKNNTAKFNVTGGSFVKFNPANNQAEGTETNFCAAGYEAVQDGDVWTVQKAPVAKIDDEMYYSLADAFAAATEGKTITLLKDVELADRLFVNAGATPAYAGTNNRYATTTENKSITLDLNGNNITTSSNIALAGGGLNIVNNGTADADHGVISTTNAGLAPIEIRGTGDLTQKRTLTVGTGVTLSGAEYGLNVFGSNDAQKNVIDVNVNGTVNGTLFVLGNLKNAENEININVAGTVYGPDNGDDEASVGVALNGIATVNVNEGAQVSGETGIEVRAGNLIVNGGNIKATASTYSEKKNGSGSCTKGAAVAVAQHTTMLPIKATLNGGTLTGTRTLVVTDVEEIGLNDVTVKAADALAKAETVVIPAGYKWVSADGMSTLTPCDYVAQIGEGENIVKYETLAEAVAAATAETTTITLLTDVKEGIVVKDGKNIVLDLNGKTMTGYIDQYDADIVVKNGTVAGTVYVNGAAENTENYNKFTLDATATIITKDYGIILWQSDKNTAYGSTIDINGTINGCVFVMGNIKEGNSVINVNDGATIKGEVGIALNGYATLNVVDGATIEGTVDSGIEVRAGKLNVTGGKISSTATTYEVKANGSGTTTTGAAIAIAQHTTGLPINANITGGTLSGPKTISVADPQGLNYTGVVVTAKDELTEGDVVIPDGYIWVSNNNGTSTLKTKEDAGIYELRDWEVYPYLSYTEDKEVTSVTYIRRFGNTNWQALYIPFDINDISELTDKYEFAKIHMVALENDGQWTTGDKIEVYYTKMTEGKIHANKPYLIRAKNSGEQSIVVKNTILHDTHNVNPMQTETTAAVYAFTGTYEGVKATSSNTFFAMGGGTINFCDNAQLGAYRWYLNFMPKTDDYAKPVVDFIESDSDATGVSSVKTGDDSDIEGYYNINGVRSETPVRGVNIIRYKNGSTKKVVIK